MAGKKRIGKNQITLARALSKFGVASRKISAELIKEGRVSVNARTAQFPDAWVDPKSDKITVDGRSLRQRKLVYLAMNKPVGVVTTRSDELGRRTVYDLLPDDSRWLFPVGRLDKDTSGLLLLTNDTRFGNQVTNPLSSVPKTYAVVIDKPLTPDVILRMEKAFVLKDGTVLKSAKITIDWNNPTLFNLTIVEGKNRQIRRMCEELKLEVRSLRRISIGSVKLGDLREGELRSLTQAEHFSITSSSIQS